MRFRKTVGPERMGGGYIWHGGTESYDVHHTRIQPYTEAGASMVSTLVLTAP